MLRFDNPAERSKVEHSFVARLALVLCATTVGLLGPLASPAVAQTHAPTPTPDARFGSPDEQSQPGSEELGAGRAAAVRSRWQEALGHFRAVLEDYPNGELADDATYWTLRSLYALGRYEEAVERANEFIDRYPRSDLFGDARVVRFEAAEALVSQGNADYERYLRYEAAPQAPPQPTRPGQAPDAPDAPDPTSELRIMALDALINMDEAAAWPILQRIVSESDEPALRGRAVWLLSQLDTLEAFDLLVDLARNDPDSEVRSNAMFWVGQSVEHVDRALDLLIDMINTGTDEEGVGQALFGLGQSASPRAQEALEALARDTTKSAELRGQALFWLGQQSGSLDLLGDIALNDPDEELRGQALFGISQIDTEEANDFLLQIARSDAPVEVRSNAIFWLGQRQDERALDVLMGLWDDVQDTEIRNQLLFALAQTNSERAVDHLVMVAKDESADPELRQQAVFWLGQSEHPKAKVALMEIIGGGEVDR